MKRHTIAIMTTRYMSENASLSYLSEIRNLVFNGIDRVVPNRGRTKPNG